MDRNQQTLREEEKEKLQQIEAKKKEQELKNYTTFMNPDSMVSNQELKNKSAKEYEDDFF